MSKPKLKRLSNTAMRNNKIIRGGKLYIGAHIGIHVLLIPIIVAAAYGGYMRFFAVCWISAFLHECTHVFVMHRFKIPVTEIVFQPFGMCAVIGTPVIKNPYHEIFSAVVGPLASLAIALFLVPIADKFPSETIDCCISANTAMFFVNLLPCLPLDGGRIMRAALTLGSDAFTAIKLSYKISCIITAMLIFVSILLLLTAQFNFSLILIGAFLAGNLCFGQKSLSAQTLRELLYYRSKPEKDCLCDTCIITAYTDLPARKILRKLSYHKYHIVHVIDTDKKIIKILTESQIIEALFTRSIQLTLGEIQ